MHQVRADDGWTVSLAFASVETESRPSCAQEFRQNWDRVRLRRGREKNWDRVRSRGGREKTGIARGREKTGIAKSLPRQDLFFMCCWELNILFVLIGHLRCHQHAPGCMCEPPAQLGLRAQLPCNNQTIILRHLRHRQHSKYMQSLAALNRRARSRPCAQCLGGGEVFRLVHRPHSRLLPTPLLRTVPR